MKNRRRAIFIQFLYLKLFTRIITVEKNFGLFFFRTDVIMYILSLILRSIIFTFTFNFYFRSYEMIKLLL